MNKKQVIIPIFVPHKGCHHECIYCNQKSISGFVEEMSIGKMRSIIDSHLSTINGNISVEIAFYGGSFTGIEEEQQLAFLKCAAEYHRAGKVNGIRLSTRPDYIHPHILEYLQYYGVNTIELGVQSMDEEVLNASCRGHNVDQVMKAARLVKESGFRLGIQTMIGLPSDTLLKDMDTALKIVGLEPAFVRIYPALVIKSTYLEKLFLNGKFQPLTLEEAVDICAQLLDIYGRNDIQVIRVGLQPTDTINEKTDVVAGPFHPAFRQLVESKRMLNSILDCIKENHLQDTKKICIYTDEKNISNVIGQNKNNIDILKETFKYEEIRIKKILNSCTSLMIESIE